MERHRYSERPPRDEYRLTACRPRFPARCCGRCWPGATATSRPKGRAWCWSTPETAAVADPVLVDRNTGRPMTARGFRSAAGPAADAATRAPVRSRRHELRMSAARWRATPSPAPARVAGAARRLAGRRCGSSPLPPARLGRPRLVDRGRFIETTDDAYVGGNVTPLAPHVAGLRAADRGRPTISACSAGQVLIRLDPHDYHAALDHAQAALEARVAALARSAGAAMLQQAAIAQQQAELAARTARAGVHRRRCRPLFAAGAQTRPVRGRTRSETFDLDQEAQAAVASTRAGLDAAQAAVAVLAARNQRGRGGDLAGRGRRDASRELNLGYTEIRSPIDGIVGNRAAQVGAYVTAGTYLISIVPAHGLWVDANFKEDQLGAMAPGAAGDGGTPMSCRSTCCTGMWPASRPAPARCSA